MNASRLSISRNEIQSMTRKQLEKLKSEIDEFIRIYRRRSNERIQEFQTELNSIDRSIQLIKKIQNAFLIGIIPETIDNIELNNLTLSDVVSALNELHTEKRHIENFFTKHKKDTNDIEER